MKCCSTNGTAIALMNLHYFLPTEDQRSQDSITDGRSTLQASFNIKESLAIDIKRYSWQCVMVKFPMPYTMHMGAALSRLIVLTKVIFKNEIMKLRDTGNLEG